MKGVKLFLAIGSFAVASLFGAAAIYLPPQGEISASANALIAQFLLLCATIIGVDIVRKRDETSWNGMDIDVEMHLGDMRIILFPRESIEKMTQQKFTYPTGINGTMEIAFEAYEATFPPKEKKQQDGQLVDDCTKNPNE